jgi:hypothetical protein
VWGFNIVHVRSLFNLIMVGCYAHNYGRHDHAMRSLVPFPAWSPHGHHGLDALQIVVVVKNYELVTSSLLLNMVARNVETFPSTNLVIWILALLLAR